MKPSVLVLGGTGTTGSRVAAAVRARGAGLRIATRRPDSSGEQVRFDWADPATHGPALDGTDRVYLLAPIGVADPVPLVEPFLEEAGERRIVLLSSSAITEDAPGLGAVHRMLREHSPEWTVLRPSWFMQNFTGRHVVADGIRERGEIVTATGDGRVAFVDADDIAAVAAEALLDPVPHNTDHVLTGPEALSYADAAAILTEVTGKPVRHRSVEPGELAASLTTSGLPTVFATWLARLDEGIRNGAEDRVSPAVHTVTGHPPRSFRVHVAENRS